MMTSILLIIIFLLQLFCTVSQSCTADNQCYIASKPQCSLGFCIYCSTEDHCKFVQNNRKRCLWGTGMCVECRDNSHCGTVDKPVCKSNNYCGGCLQDSDCTNHDYPGCAGPSCNTCTIGGDCAGYFTPERIACISGKCAECQQHTDCGFDKPICDAGTNKCEPCTSNSQCLNKPGYVKCQGGKCKECNSDADCSGGKVCFNSMCHECAQASDCPTSKPICDSNVCKICSSDSECSNSYANLPICVSGQCKECNGNSHCTNPLKSKCQSNVCNQCSIDNDCSHQLPTPLCFTSTTNKCVQCLSSSDCGIAQPICDSNACRMCQVDLECADININLPICITLGQCKECGDNIHCTDVSKSKCQGYVCTQCQAHADCSHLTQTPYCDSVSNTCVECITSGNCSNDINLPICTAAYNCVSCSDGGSPNHLVCKNKNLAEPFCFVDKCVECLADSDCSNDPIKPICKNNVCSPCLNDNECKIKDQLEPYCLNQKCVECENSSHCITNKRAKCDSSNICVPCDDSIHCTNPIFSHCKISMGECFNCTQNTHCMTTLNPFCEQSTLSCQVCRHNQDCAHIESNSICDLQYKKCINLQFNLNVSQIHIKVNEKIPIQILLNSSLSGTSNRGKMISNFQDDVSNVIELKSNLSNSNISKPVLVDQQNNIFHISPLQKLITNHISYFEIEFTISNTMTTLNQKVQVFVKDPCWLHSHCNSSILECSGDFKCYNPQGSFLILITEIMTGIGVAIMSTAGPMMALGADPTLVYGIIHIMQVLYYILFYNVRYPYNAQLFLDLFKMGRLEFLPSPFSGFSSGFENEEIVSPPNFMDNDFTGLFIQSAGGILFLIVSNLGIYGVSKIIQAKFFPTKLRSFGQKLVKDFEWSGLLRIWLVSYLELMIASTLQITLLDSSNSIKAFSSILGFIVFCLNGCLPFGLYKLLKKVNDKKQLGKFTSAFEDYVLTANFTKLFVVFSISRQLLQSLFLVWLYYYPIAQVFFNWALVMVFSIALINQRPHMKISQNFLEVFSELMFFVLHSVILCFAIDDSVHQFNEKVRWTLGWIMIASCSLLILVYFGFLLVEEFLIIKSVGKMVIGFISARAFKNKARDISLKKKKKEKLKLNMRGRDKEKGEKSQIMHNSRSQPSIIRIGKFGQRKNIYQTKHKGSNEQKHETYFI